MGPELGDGSLSMVYLSTEAETGKIFAMKVCDRSYLRSQKKDADITMEEHCLRRANHPGIIKLHACFSDEKSRYLALEYCPGGDLWAMVKNVGCSDRIARHYLAQVLEAVSYLRDAQIVHRDLKAENVLIGPAGNTKLVDFGSAKDLANPHIKGAGTRGFKETLEDNVGTPNFMAPEVINNKRSDFRSDVWSVGCMLFQVLTGLPPFGTDLYRVYKLALKARLDVPPSVSSIARELIKRIVVLDPDARLGALDIRQIQAHPYFATAQFDGPRFQGAHGKAAPVPSLGDYCLRKIGRNWDRYSVHVSSWLALKGEDVPADTRAILVRFRSAAENAAALQAKADSGEVPSDSSSTDEGETAPSKKTASSASSGGGRPRLGASTAAPKTGPGPWAPTAAPKTGPGPWAPAAAPKSGPGPWAPTAAPRTGPGPWAPSASPKAGPGPWAPPAAPKAGPGPWAPPKGS